MQRISILFERSLIRLVAMAGLVVGVAVSSCTFPQRKCEIGTEPDFVGFITIIDRGSGKGEVTGQIIVESHADKLVHRHVITVTNDTVILRRDGEINHRVNFDSLEVKNWVKVWFSGAKKPYPVKVTARQLTVTDSP